MGGRSAMQHQAAGRAVLAACTAAAAYAEELTPEDIFNMFFGMPPQAARGHAHHQYRQAPPRGRPQAQVAPFALLMLLSLASSLPFGGPSTRISSSARPRVWA